MSNHQKSSRRQAPSAFTLVELLVVISIIGLLMSLLLPALSKTRTVTRNAICGTNQRGIVQALLIYEGDYKMLPLMHGVELRSENPLLDHFAGPVIWGPTGNLGVAGFPSLGVNVNMPLGMGQLLPGSYISINLFYCPEYQNGQLDGWTDQTRLRAWGKRKFLYGKPYTASSATVIAYPDGDGLGIDVGCNFLRSDYHYRGGDMSYTPNLGSIAGVLRTGGAYLKSGASTSAGNFGVKSITADFRYWWHALNGQNVGRGDGSVIWVPNTRINDALGSEVAAGITPAATALNYPFRWISWNAFSPQYPAGNATRQGVTATYSTAMLEKLDQVINNY